MELKLLKSKKLLLSTPNQEEIYNKTYCVDNIQFKLGELEKLHKLDNEVLWKRIINNLQDIKKSLVSYQTEKGLTLFGKKFDDKVICISSGESQRGIYQMYLEGSWKIIDKEIS